MTNDNSIKQKEPLNESVSNISKVNPKHVQNSASGINTCAPSQPNREMQTTSSSGSIGSCAPTQENK